MINIRKFDKSFFYNSKEWKRIRAYMIAKANYCCELCGRADRVLNVHHKIHLNESNIHDYNITLNEDNLIVLCDACHRKIHANNNTLREGLVFDEEGNIKKI